MSNKKKLLTKAIYDNLPNNNPFNDLPLEKLIFRWWTTGRNSSGLRLSDEGKMAFDLAEIEYYEFLYEMDSTTFPYKVLEIGKKLNCPFYVGFKNRLYKSAYIRVYDSKVAMLINLYGSFAEYLESTKRYA